MVMTDPIADMLTRIRNANSVHHDKVDKVHGMDIIIVTTARTDEEARELLRLLGMPFAA